MLSLARSRGLSCVPKAYSHVTGSFLRGFPVEFSPCRLQPGDVPGVRTFRSAAIDLKAIQFNLTDIGEGIFEVEILQWYVKEGDKVQAFEKICEVASDKASVEITSRYTGVVTKLHHNVGDMARVGEPLIGLEVPDTKDAGPKQTPVASSTPTPPPTPPPSPPLPTPTEAAPRTAPPSAPLPSTPATAPTPHPSGPVLCTPAVRAIAKEHNIDLRQVPGTGKDGRVMKEDILHYIKQGAAAGKPPVAAAPTASSGPTEGDRVEVLRGVQKVMFKSMTESLSIPTFSCGDTCDVDALMQLRKRCNEHLQSQAKAGGRPLSMSYLPFILKATSLALEQYPIINSTLNAETLEVTYKSRHNIGVAMDTAQGLVVPGVMDVQRKSIRQIAEELAVLQELASTNKLLPEHFQNTTFTLSNIGTIGATWAIPVVFAPQVAIGAIGKIEKMVAFDDSGNVVPKHVMHFGWSADHRVVDGATMVRFSNLLLSYLRNPELMLVEI